MATYHLNVRRCSKAKGQSAKAKSDYINREDKYSKRFEDLQYSSSGNMPTFAQNGPEKFWEYADIYERSNARVCTEIVFALPRELNLEQQKDLVADFVKNTIDNDQHKLPYSLAIHNDKDNHNPHCHLIFSERSLDGIERSADQFFKRANSKNPELGGAKKSTHANSKEFVQEVRTTWRELANQHLEQHGHIARIDERTLEAQGIDREASRRINRPEFQAMRALECEYQQVTRVLATCDEVIELQKRLIEQEKRQEQPQKQGEIPPANSFGQAFNNVVSQEIAKNTPKSNVEPFLAKDNEIHGEENKTQQRANKELSQAEFDQFLIDKWLEPSRQMQKGVEKLHTLDNDFERHVAELKRLQERYDRVTEKNKGFLGLWETKEQKQEKAEIESEYLKIKRLRNSVDKDRSDLRENLDQYHKNTLEPLQKQIEQIRENNPGIKMRNIKQLTSMQFQGVSAWHKEQKQLKAEREQQKQKRELERKLDRGFSL